MEHHFIYILYSDSKDRYYVGSSADPVKRLERHNAGATPSTKTGRPWKIVYTEEFENRSAAIKREIYIKRQKSKIFLEGLIANR